MPGEGSIFFLFYPLLFAQNYTIIKLLFVESVTRDSSTQQICTSKMKDHEQNMSTEY